MKIFVFKRTAEIRPSVCRATFYFSSFLRRVRTATCVTASEAVTYELEINNAIASNTIPKIYITEERPQQKGENKAKHFFYNKLLYSVLRMEYKKSSEGGIRVPTTRVANFTPPLQFMVLDKGRHVGVPVD